MAKFDVDRLYERYYAGDKAREGVFRAVASWTSPRRVLYPGSFVHVAASFAFPSVTYVDMDRRAERFFAHASDVRALIDRHKRYAEATEFRFHASSYEAPLDEPDQSFDLLFSLYAGFISQPCKRYLSVGGILVVNNSHGDAGLASLDPDFEFIGALEGPEDRLRVTEDSLDEFFQPKRGVLVTEELLRSSGRGVAYTKVAPAYLFRLLR